MPQQKHTLPQPFRDENYLCLAAVRNDMRLLGTAQILRRVTIFLEQLNILAKCFCW